MGSENVVTNSQQSWLRRFLGVESVKTMLTAGSLAVAITALVISNNTSDRQAELAEQTQQLQEQSLQIQQKTYEERNGVSRMTDLMVKIWNTRDVTIDYPQNGRVIPLSSWNDNPVRYIYFTLSNVGGAALYVDRVGLGANETGWEPVAKADLYCLDPVAETYSVGCSPEIAPATERRYAFAVSELFLTRIDESWQSRGVELCVDFQAVGFSCNTFDQVAFPQGARIREVAPR